MRTIFLLTAEFALCLSLLPAAPSTRPSPGHSIQGSYGRSETTVKTFTGTVMKQGDLYVLVDKANKTNYQLDDPKKVSEFDGKQVKVTGTLNAENLIIHVETIAEVS